MVVFVPEIRWLKIVYTASCPIAGDFSRPL